MEGARRHGLRYFNSRPCERGDGAYLLSHTPQNTFQFSPLREGRPVRDGLDAARTDFNSRPCERGDSFPGDQPRQRFYFNSRPCERGDRMAGHVHVYDMNFNSRPCERGDAAYKIEQDTGLISIPAPARGATQKEQDCQSYRQISIPAPARGATCQRFAASGFSSYFNSRPCERGDDRGIFSKWLWPIFQFPPLREGRPFQNFRIREIVNFNSRPCERGDHRGNPHGICRSRISIPAPARGATFSLRMGWRHDPISIPAPARGATSVLSWI